MSSGGLMRLVSEEDGLISESQSTKTTGHLYGTSSDNKNLLKQKSWHHLERSSNGLRSRGHRRNASAIFREFLPTSSARAEREERHDLASKSTVVRLLRANSARQRRLSSVTANTSSNATLTSQRRSSSGTTFTLSRSDSSRSAILPIPTHDEEKKTEGDGVVDSKSTTESEAMATEYRKAYHRGLAMHCVPQAAMALDRSMRQESDDIGDYESAAEKFSELGLQNGTFTRRKITRWVLLAITGVLTGVSALLISWGNRFLHMHKFANITQPVINHYKNSGDLFNPTPYFVYVGTCMVYTLVAVLTIAVGETVASGSGIPELKCILNGEHVPRATRAKTWLMKVVGTAFSAGAGLPIGKEGPTIHSGAIVGACVSQGKTSFASIDKCSSVYLSDFRNDKEKKDFIASGAAAGVAAAFGAPIGGVLFCLEEGSSWWYPELTWRTFFCALVGVTTSTFLMSGLNAYGIPDTRLLGISVSSPGIFTVSAESETIRAQSDNYRLWEVPLFMCVGLLGGVLGGFFNWLNVMMLRCRKRYIWGPNDPSGCDRKGWWRRTLEGVFVGWLVGTIVFAAPFLASIQSAPKSSGNSTAVSGSWSLGRNCVPLPNNSALVKQYAMLPQFYCDDGEYDEWAILYFAPLEGTIRLLLYYEHVPGVEGIWTHPPTVTFDYFSLASFFIFFFFLTCIAAGLSVPSSPFIPALLAGCALGRIVGQVVQQVTIANGFEGTITPGLYALVGAGSVLCGVLRMVFALSVILLESTDNMQMALPVMSALIVARWAGNHFTEPLYELYIETAGRRFLEWSPPKWFSKLHMNAVMTPTPVCLRTVEKVSVLCQVLEETTHNCFPVVIGDGQGNGMLLNGVILRKYLLALLDPRNTQGKEIFCATRPVERVAHCDAELLRYHDQMNRGANLKWRDFQNRRESGSNGMLNLNEEGRLPIDERWMDMWVDLAPYIGMAHSINQYASLKKGFRVFRQLGMRHLVCVTPRMEVTGIVTRGDLTLHHVEHKYKEHFQMGEEEEDGHQHH